MKWPIFISGQHILPVREELSSFLLCRTKAGFQIVARQTGDRLDAQIRCVPDTKQRVGVLQIRLGVGES